MQLSVAVVSAIDQVGQAEWDAVAFSGGEVNPFVSWRFLHILEASGSAVRGVSSAWRVCGEARTAAPPISSCGAASPFLQSQRGQRLGGARASRVYGGPSGARSSHP
jgi:predicted N-acyltransferase